MKLYTIASFPRIIIFNIIILIAFSCVSDQNQKVNRSLLDSVDNSSQYQKQLAVGAENLAKYIPVIKGKKTALVVNHSSKIGNAHLIDTLLSLDINITKIFSPEHGFTGMADAGEKVQDSHLSESKTIPLLSLYGKKRKPSKEDLEGIEVMIFDIQDIGVRFYTYISTMHYVMEACAENSIPLIILDRPNPNGHYIDGPILNPTYKSFVGMHPIPVVHGMTVGELARMINAEGWLNDGISCDLTIVKNTNYTHNTPYTLPLAPSPNLPDELSILLYPSTCFFEGTHLSEGRGTKKPFAWIGHPSLTEYEFSFIPQPTTGAKNPKLNGETCYGLDLSSLSIENFRAKGKIELTWLIDFYSKWDGKEGFFKGNGWIDKLAGSDQLRKKIENGWTADEISASWIKGLEEFNQKRKKYLLYPDYE